MQDCVAGLFAYVPPRVLPNATMLLVRRCNPSAASGVVIRHTHLLDEHLPHADVLEQRILRDIKSTGSFLHRSAEVKQWLGEVLPRIGAWQWCSFQHFLETDARPLHCALQRKITRSMRPLASAASLTSHCCRWVGRTLACPPLASVVYVAGITPHTSECAKQWRTECQRVLFRGERVSLVFGDDLPLGYRVMLARLWPLAFAADDAELLTATYFGQEHRGAKSKGKCCRWMQHTTKQGSRNICQVKFITDRRSGYVCKPLGDVTVEVRFVAMLPAGENYIARVNGAEALAFAACESVAGFVGLNDSPPGEDTRLLVTTWAGPPRIFQFCGRLIEAIGGEEKASKPRLCDSSVSLAAGPFLRGVLEAVHLHMENGLYLDKDSAAMTADFEYGTRTRYSKFSVLTLVSAVYACVDVDGRGRAEAPQRVYTLALWCDACSCPYIGPLCKHLIAGRILRLVQRVSPSWHGNDEALYCHGGLARHHPTPSAATPPRLTMPAHSFGMPKRRRVLPRTSLRSMLLLGTTSP